MISSYKIRIFAFNARVLKDRLCLTEMVPINQQIPPHEGIGIDTRIHHDLRNVIGELLEDEDL